MRLDKFLKVSRLIKRRTVAKELCDQGRVTLNEKPAKASAVVCVGDRLTIVFGQKVHTVHIESVVDSVKKENAMDLFSIIEEKAIPKKVEDCSKL